MSQRAPSVPNQAFVTLATNDDYVRGALVLGYSLQTVQTSRSLVVMVTSTVSLEQRSRLSQVYHLVHEVPQLDSQDAHSLALLSRPELGVTYTKLNAWQLTQFDKCVFLDADTLVLKNVDELFDRPELSAAPDVGWPDCFNSGVFVFVPSEATYQSLIQHAASFGSFDGGDQGLLNSYWSDWSTSSTERRLPFVYNLTVSTCYSYQPALRRFGRDARIVHFLGGVKPWHHTYHPSTGQLILYPGSALTQEGIRQFLNYWWTLYITFVDQPPMVIGNQTVGYPTFDFNNVTHFVPSNVALYSHTHQDFPSVTVTECENPPEHEHHYTPVTMSPPLIVFGEPVAPEPHTDSYKLDTSSSDTSTEPACDIALDFQDYSNVWRQRWEEGQIDYQGQDSYDRIHEHLEHVLAGAPTQPWSIKDDQLEDIDEEEEESEDDELFEEADEDEEEDEDETIRVTETKSAVDVVVDDEDIELVETVESMKVVGEVEVEHHHKLIDNSDV